MFFSLVAGTWLIQCGELFAQSHSSENEEKATIRSETLEERLPIIITKNQNSVDIKPITINKMDVVAASRKSDHESKNPKRIKMSKADTNNVNIKNKANMRFEAITIAPSVEMDTVKPKRINTVTDK